MNLLANLIPSAGPDGRVLGAQILICVAVAVLAAFWPLVEFTGTTLSQGLASGLGSIALILPSALFVVWSKRTVSAAESAEAGAQRILGLAGLRIIGTMTLMVIAFALMRAQAQWVLIGVAAAAIGQVVASMTSGHRASVKRKA